MVNSLSHLIQCITLSLDSHMHDPILIMVFQWLKFRLQEFQWNRQLRGWILGAFYFGYVPFQIPFGIMANRFGGKWPLFWGMCFLTIGTFVSPVSARVSPYLLLALQVIKGVACVSNVSSTRKCRYNAVQYIIFLHAKSWIPGDEKSIFTVVIH